MYYHKPGTYPILRGNSKRSLPRTLAPLSPAHPRRWGAGVTNDWCITLHITNTFFNFWVSDYSIFQSHDFTVFRHRGLSELVQVRVSHSMTKPTKWHVRPAKTQISLGICPIWSESSLCTLWVAKGLKVSSCRQQRLWSVWAYAQADLSLCRAHSSFCQFCHAATQMICSLA